MLGVGELLKEMPEGYEQACIETKAMIRKRGVTRPADLMMLALFHLQNGCSLMEISEIARLTKLGSMSDVAFMNRFKHCNEWFKWIIKQVQSGSVMKYEKPEYLKEYKVIGIDASDVSEKGRSGRIYRLHFALDLFDMQAEEYKITTNKVGEALTNFHMQANQLYIADRAYGTLRGIKHCLEGKSDYILRLRKNSFQLYNTAGEKIDLLSKLTTIKEEEVLDINGYGNSATNQDGQVPIRICARRKTAKAIVTTEKKIKRKESKRQFHMREETKEFQQYIVVLTSLPSTITAEQVLDTYRYRWQVEIYFKRLKSILDFGELPKRQQESVMAWLNGKLMISLLIESIVSKAAFSPQEKSKP